MLLLHKTLIQLHIICGAASLLLFWMPVLSRKGSRWHVRSGQLYNVAMTVVAVCGLLSSVMVLIDPLAIRHPGAVIEAERAASLAWRYRTFSLFLLMLSVLVLTSLRHGTLSLRERRQPGALGAPSHQALVLSLGVLGLMVGALGGLRGQMLLLIFGGISLASAVGLQRDIWAARRGEANLLTAHLGSMIGSGIGAYTGFFAFGGARYLADWLPGQWQIIPWVLPSVIGLVAIRRLKRRYLSSRPLSSRPLSSNPAGAGASSTGRAVRQPSLDTQAGV